MFPSEIYEELKNGTIGFQTFHATTLLYADIVGFTAWSAEKEPREVVHMLSELFSKFDKICFENNVYKVHTIGDCYVVMGFHKTKQRDPV